MHAYLPQKLISGPEISPMLPAEPSSSVEKYQIIQLQCAGWASLNNEAKIDKICTPWHPHHPRVYGEVRVCWNSADFCSPWPVNKELLTGTFLVILSNWCLLLLFWIFSIGTEWQFHNKNKTGPGSDMQTRTVPDNKELLIGTVPVNKSVL